MKSVDGLLSEAKYGLLTREEISYVVQKIKESTPDDDFDLYTLIHILGLSEAKEHRELVESFLYYPSDPMVAGMALKALCTYWNEAKNYLHLIKAFIRGVDWDKDDDLRLAAMHCARDFLSQTPEKELISMLFSIFEESNRQVLASKKGDPYLKYAYSKAPLWREVAFEALAFAIGKTMEDFIASPPDEKFVDTVLEQAAQLIKKLD